MAKVLLVDDEQLILEMLIPHFEDAGHEVFTAVDGRQALRSFFQHHPDILVTDLRMPVMDGLTLISRVREVSDIPIIALSALGEEEDKVKGLELGADDYVVKPVGIHELIARIEAALRRAKLQPSEATDTYKDGAITIFLDRKEVYVGSQKVDLTPKEMQLLLYLTRKAGKVISVPELLREVWGSIHYSEDSVKWHIASLRKRIERDPENPRLIVTVRGSGYRYDRPFAPPDLASIN